MSGVDRGWKVTFTSRADTDVLGIIAFIGEREGANMAESILEKFIKARDSLSELPNRGRIPPELQRVNILSYREIHVPPYRLIYQINKRDRTVHIHMVVDGRRNMTELLKERLLTL